MHPVQSNTAKIEIEDREAAGYLFGHIGLTAILKTFRWKISVTWLLVLFENVMLALIPLLIGYSIDGLLEKSFDELFLLAGVFVVLTIISVCRRVYDTRAYGLIRVRLGTAINKQHLNLPVSTQTARLDMARELVDFLEEEAPALITAVIQIITALVLLSLFHSNLSLSAIAMTLAMIVLYSLFHQRFYRLNSALNGQMERQVGILEKCNSRGVFNHLNKLRKWEVRLSDTEAVLYGLIFLLATAFTVYNLWFSTQRLDVTSGQIFTIVTYSWEYVEAAIMLPFTLQSWSRLHEITQRINQGGSAELEK